VPAPLVVAERWWSDATRRQHGRDAPQGTGLVEGQQSSVFPWANGAPGTGHDRMQGEVWPWRQHPWEPGVRSARLRATSPPSGQVPVVLVDEPSPDRFSLLWLETERSAP
jgi:hypothetical protein